MKLRGTATEELADVIQMLLFVQKCGILTVQRESPGNIVEEGSLLIQGGQIIDAVIGNLRGADALKKINTWTKCYFVFQAQAPSANAPVLTPPVQMPPAQMGFNQSSELQNQALQSASAFAVIPGRTPQYQWSMPDFDHLGLSRVHRQLFLLADGQRSIDVLAKLLGRHPQEVLSMLHDMENLQLLRRL